MKAETPPSDVPLISIVMAVKDGELFLEEAVRAVLAQTFTDFELVIVDDGSTDGTHGILHRMAAEDSRIRLVILGKNIRLAGALNKGLEAARGTYIARTDADDIAHPAWLQTELDYMQAHPDVDLVGASVRHISADGAPIKDADYAGDADEVRWQMRFMAPFSHPTIMFRRLPRAGTPAPRYDPDFRYAEDYDFCARMLETGKGVNLPDFLLQYRIHGASLSQTKWHNQIQDAEIIATRFSCRAGYLTTLGGLFIAGATVHFWHALMAFTMFFLASGLWMITGGERCEDQDTGPPEPQKKELTYTRSKNQHERVRPDQAKNRYSRS